MTITKEQVVAARHDAGMTQQQAADLLGVNIRSWKRYEYGEREMHPLFFEAFQTKAKKRKPK
jgi:putative transcriptional regulator